MSKNIKSYFECVNKRRHYRMSGNLFYYFWGLILVFLFACGMNVDPPVVLQPLSNPAAVTTQIYSLMLIPSGLDTENKNAVQIQYYLNNTEGNFLGHNLYITTVPQTISNLFGGYQKEHLYLERGIEPSFSASRVLMEARGTVLVSHMIRSKTAGPAPTPFYSNQCLVYYFRLTAVLRGGFESLPSDEKLLCASSDLERCRNMPTNPCSQLPI